MESAVGGVIDGMGSLVGVVYEGWGLWGGASERWVCGGVGFLRRL